MNGGLQCFGDIVGGGVIEELILFVPQHDLREDKALVEGFIPEIFDDIPAADSPVTLTPPPKVILGTP